MNNMKTYKGVAVAKGSELYEALEVLSKCKPNSEPAKAAQEAVKRVHAGIEERFAKLYSKEDRDWFYARNNKGALAQLVEHRPVEP